MNAKVVEEIVATVLTACGIETQVFLASLTTTAVLQ